MTPGYYELRPRDHMGNVMRVLHTPPARRTPGHVPRGLHVRPDGQRALDAKMPRMTARRVRRSRSPTARSRSTLSRPGVTSLEGLLFPDTYQVSNAETEAQVIAADGRPDGARRRARRTSTPKAAAQLGLTPYQVLIVASMIEREAKIDEDRPKIARVIYNRLYLGHAAADRRHAALRPGPATTPFADARGTIDTPYNTYLHRPAADADRQPRPGVDRGGAHPAPNPAGRPDLCRRCPADAVHVPLLRARRRGRPPRLRGDLRPARGQRRRGRKLRACSGDRRPPPGVAAVIGAPGRAQPVAGDPQRRVRRAGLDWVVRRVRGRAGRAPRPRSRRCARSASAGCR